MGLRLQFWLQSFEWLYQYRYGGGGDLFFFLSAFSPGWVGLGLGVFGVWRFFVLLFVLSFTISSWFGLV